jgi:hypothetical protein
MKDMKINYVFSPNGIESKSALQQSRFDWSLVDRFFEFRDGFVLVSGTVASWVPKHAFTEAFEEIELSELGRKRAKNYKFIDRVAAPS